MTLPIELAVTIGLAVLGQLIFLAVMIGDRDRRLKTTEESNRVTRRNVHMMNNVLHRFFLKQGSTELAEELSDRFDLNGESSEGE